jgi:hypothetical protein
MGTAAGLARHDSLVVPAGPAVEGLSAEATPVVKEWLRLSVDQSLALIRDIKRVLREEKETLRRWEQKLEVV